MIERLLENWLDSASERSYQPVFVQMLSARGYRVVHSTRHTALEYGKDILAIDSSGCGCAFQLKGHPGGKLGLSEFRDHTQQQLVQLMTQAVVFPGFPDGPHKSFLVCNGYFDEEVQRAVDDLNRMHYLSKVELISRGELLSWCKEYGASLWPSELRDTRLLLELFLSDPKNILPTVKLSQLLGKILAINSNDAEINTAPEFYRAVTSSALLTGIAISGFAEAENHYAVISAWTLFAVSTIAAGEKHGFKITGAALETLNLAETAILDELAQLWNEVVGRDHLIEGSAFSDSELYNWRYILLLGLLSCLAFYDENNMCLNEESRTKLKEWLIKRHKNIRIWGEGAIASLVPWLVWLRKNDSTERPDYEIANLTKAVITMNQPNSPSPLVNPYYNYEEIVRYALKLNPGILPSPLDQESFKGNSFVAEPLFHLLVRTNLKRTCKELWPDFTRITHLVCLPDYGWQYCTIEISSGPNQSKIYPSTYKWDDLRVDVIQPRKVMIPQELCKRPFLLVLWWQVVPYRYTTDSNKVFVEGTFPGWGEW